jgi:hypothetical protein
MSTTIKDTQKMIEEVLDAYPEKAKKDRAKHLAANDPTVVAIQKTHQPQVVLLGQCNHILNIHEHFS